MFDACSFDSAALYGSGGLGTALYRALHTTPAGDSVDFSTFRGAVEQANDCAVLTDSSGNSTICPSIGRFWSDAFGADTDANAAWWSEPLDAALPTSSRSSWGRVTRGRARRVLTAHHVVAPTSTRCAAVVRVHYYCDRSYSSDDEHVRLEAFGAARESSPVPTPARRARPATTPPSLRRVRSKPCTRRTLRCRRCATSTALTRPPSPVSNICIAHLAVFGPGRRGYGNFASMAAAGREATYGEISREGILQLIDLLPAEHRLGRGSVFVDIGSGVGKLVVAVAMVSEAAAFGIELSTERATMAADAVASAASLGLLSSDEVDRITLAQGDATADGALPQGTSHVWLANTCFPEGLTRALLAAIVALPNLRCVVALQPLPQTPPGDACGLELVATRLLRHELERRARAILLLQTAAVVS